MDNGLGLKKFDGLKRSRRMEPLKGGKAALAALGILVILVFLGVSAVNKWNGNTEKTVTLDYTACYYPSEKADLYSAKKLMLALQKSQNSSCPRTTLGIANDTMSITEGLSETGRDLLSIHLTTKSFISKDIREENNPVNKNVYNTSDSVKLAELYSVDNVDYFPIIAPFSFDFLNANTSDDGKTIAIRSSNGKVKIVFKNVVGWFCATDKSSPSKADIESHISHGTVVGASPNSNVQSGSMGALIGFADEETTVEFYEWVSDDKESGWKPVSFKTLWTGSK